MYMTSHISHDDLEISRSRQTAKNWPATMI
jgi:hypothetical protein